mgnify:CR=1 FL=1
MKKFTILLPALVLILFTANPSVAEKIAFSRVSGGDFYIYTADGKDNAAVQRLRPGDIARRRHGRLYAV